MSDIDRIYRHISITVAFIARKSGANPMFEEIKKVIEKEYSKKNLKGLNIVLRDVKEWSRGLSKSDLAELEGELYQALDVDSKQEDDEEIKTMDGIIAANMIVDAHQYRDALAFVEKCQGDESEKRRVEKLNQLLAEYHGKQ
nr:hypothetical protein [uncultured Desulfobacter sp.]